MGEWIDLTQPIHEEIPVRPLHKKPVFRDYMTIDEDGTNSTVIQIETHVGTHMDAPAHFLPADDHRTIDELKPTEMVSEGVIFDFSHKDPGTKITRAEVEGKAQQYNLCPGDYVILKLGMEPQDNEKYLENYIYPSEGFIEYLLEKGISCLASEALNVDKSGQALEDHTVHYQLLSSDIFIVEGLTNLDGVEEGRYNVICTPLPYVGRDGSQVRFLVNDI